MSAESVNGAASHMSDSISSASDSGHDMTNETEDYPDDDVSEVYSLEIFETVKKGLRADRRFVLYAAETKQCLQAILTFVEAERLTAEAFRPSREFLTQVFPILWKHILRKESTENLLPEFVAWGRLLNKIALALLEKIAEIDYKIYSEMALRAFTCLELFFDAETLIYLNGNFPEPVRSPMHSPEAEEDTWPRSLATEMSESCLEIVCKLLERFFSHQIYEEYSDPTYEELLEAILGLFARMTYVGMDRKLLQPLAQVAEAAIADMRKSRIENISFTFLSSPSFVEHLYRVVFYANSADSAEETVGVFRRQLLKEELKQGNFKSRLAALRCLASYLDAVAHFEDPVPLQRLQTWLNQEDIVGMMLASHVEKVHYAEHVLGVLERMVKCEIFETEHIDALWSLIEPDGVFEGLRDNMLHMTSGLAKKMSLDHVRYIIDRISKGVGSAGYLTKNFVILHSILQREDTSIDHVEPLLKLYWEVLLEMARIDDPAKTANFRDCIQNFFQRGCYDLPEKYLQESIGFLQTGQISATMVQVFAEMYLLAEECYPNKQLDVDPLDLLVSTLERYHQLMEKIKSSSTAVDIFYCRRIILQILHAVYSLHRGLSLDLMIRIWDVCVVRPLHEAVRDDVLRWLQDRMDFSPHFFSAVTLSEFLHERMCRLEVAEMDLAAFDCFRACLFKSSSYFREDIDVHPAMEYLWNIFLNTEIPDVVSSSKSMIIKLYLHFERLSAFLQKLMASLSDSLSKLAGEEAGVECNLLIEKLCERQVDIDGIYGMYISRCVDALDCALSQATTEKQFATVTTLKNILSQSEKMHKILVFLADSQCPASLRDSVCIVLDILPIYQPLLHSLNEVLHQTVLQKLTEAIEGLLFPSKSTKHTVEQTRYALTALTGALRHVSSGREDYEELACRCLLYILNVLGRVELSTVMPGDVPAAQQRLHSVAVEVVGHLMRQLKLKKSATHSAHSSPQGEDTKARDQFVEMQGEVEDNPVVSESSHDLDSDAMDFSLTKTEETRSMPEQKRKGESPMVGRSVREETIAETPFETEAVDSVHRAAVEAEISTGQSPSVPAHRFFLHACSFVQELDLQGCMSVDSVSYPSRSGAIPAEKRHDVQSAHVMGRVVEYLINVAVDASHAWTPASDPALMDVHLIEVAVDQLIKMVEQWSHALDYLLAYPGIVEVLMRALLNPFPKIRRAFWQLSATIASKSEAAAEALYKWTREHREQADRDSVHCDDFYLLIEHLIQLTFKHPSPEQVQPLSKFLLGTGYQVEDARKLAHELIQSIREGPYERRLGGTKLSHQLGLIAALMNVLEPDAQLPYPEADLVTFLIQEILFPEAVFLKKMQIMTESLQTDAILDIMKTKTNPECARRAAFDLLLKLMRKGSSNHRMALDCLNELHFGSRAAVREVAGSNAAKAPHGYVGLQNGGATCYINSIIQQLFMQPSVRDTILAAKGHLQREEYSRSAFSALQKVFGYLQASGRRCYYPREFLENFTHSDGTRIDVRQHHDALEFFQRTQELVDEHLVRHGMKPIIKNVVGTTHVQQIICKENGETYISESEQTYTSCSLDIVGKTNLHESLEAYVQGELLEGSDAYHCEPIGKKVPALKRLCLKSPPMTLVLQLKRFEMDYQLMETYKNNDRFEFPMELNIFPYTASGLMQNEGITKHNGGDDSPKLNPAQCLYHLKGIVVHTGEIDGGHYYSFVKERPGMLRPASQCVWWRFDDSFVEVWDPARLDEDCYGGTTGIDIHDAQRITKMNNAYILFYEHVPFAEESGSGVASQSKDVPPAVPTTHVPLFIEQEVLNDNLVLLAACRLAEQNYMAFILKLLRTMPSKDDLNRRKIRRVTPGSGRGDSTCESSSASVSSGEKPTEESCTSRGERIDELITTVKNVASVACEYIFKVILTPCVFSHEDGIGWADAISAIVENSISRDIALQKMVEHAEQSFRCLVLQGNEAAKDFLSQFLTKLIQSLSTPENQGHLDVMDMRIMKFLSVILDSLDHHWNINFDVSRVLDIACLIAEALHSHGNKTPWLNLFESLMSKACRFSRFVYMQGRGQLLRSLDITNRCIIRLVSSCLEHTGHTSHILRKVRDSSVELDEENEAGSPLMGLDPTFGHMLTKFGAQRHLLKSLLRPITLVDPGTVRLLTLMTWDNEQGSLLLLDCMQDYFPEMENCDGERFVLIANAFLDLVTVKDHYNYAKLSYLLFKGSPALTPWALILSKIQTLLRWRLLYILMLACQREDRAKEEIRPAREWDRVLDWMRDDIAAIPSVQGEMWLDKQEILRWASQFEVM